MIIEALLAKMKKLCYMTKKQYDLKQKTIRIVLSGNRDSVILKEVYCIQLDSVQERKIWY